MAVFPETAYRVPPSLPPPYEIMAKAKDTVLKGTPWSHSILSPIIINSCRNVLGEVMMRANKLKFNFNSAEVLLVVVGYLI